MYKNTQAVINSGDSYQGIALLERLIAEHPAYAIAHNDLGVLYTQRGDYDLASKHHELAVRFEPGNPVFKKNLAALYYTL
ncbi:tetratricopeptide repeat protein, partial [bacterium]|nr:tetratricopeptide repeat protein [bacterium]